MPDRINDYIRSKVSDNRGFTVKGASFDAITVELGDRRITLHIGGLPTGIQSKNFPMPADPAMLRDLADALCMAADDVEARWAKRDGGQTLGWRPPVTEGDLYSY